MARNFRNSQPREIARQTGQVLWTGTTTAAIVETVALKDTRLKRASQVAGGTLIRYKADFSRLRWVSGTANPTITVWGIVADSDSVIADLPDPTQTGDEDLFAPYLFITKVTMPNDTEGVGGSSEILNPPSESCHIDIKAMRRLEDNQRLFICAVADAGSGNIIGQQMYFWKAPKA